MSSRPRNGRNIVTSLEDFVLKKQKIKWIYLFGSNDFSALSVSQWLDKKEKKNGVETVAIIEAIRRIVVRSWLEAIVNTGRRE